MTFIHALPLAFLVVMAALTVLPALGPVAGFVGDFWQAARR